MSNELAVANPEPTTVTVVPTEADVGLTTVTVGASTVNCTEVKPRPAAIVCAPADAVMVNATVLVLTSGQTWAAPTGVATADPSTVMLAGAAVPK